MKKKRKPTYYEAFSLCDGTVLTAGPVRKPSRRFLKDYRIEIDPDGVGAEYLQNTWDVFRHPACDERARRHDLIANRLNMRRAIRELVLPQMLAIQAQLDRLEQRLNAVLPA